jgi:hypothetical protein
LRVQLKPDRDGLNARIKGRHALAQDYSGAAPARRSTFGLVGGLEAGQ